MQADGLALVLEANVAHAQPVLAFRQRQREETVLVGQCALTAGQVEDGRIQQRLALLIAHVAAHGPPLRLSFSFRQGQGSGFQHHVLPLHGVVDAQTSEQPLQRLLQRQRLHVGALVRLPHVE